MKIHAEGECLFLEKDGQRIGACQYQIEQETGAVQILSFEIAAQWRRKGYGSYLCKALLKHTGAYLPKQASLHYLVLPTISADVLIAFFRKFDFVQQENTLVRRYVPDLTAIAFTQDFLAQHLCAPTRCIDATCGNGHDSVFLAQLMRGQGELLAIDLQEQAVENTKKRLLDNGYSLETYKVYCDNHSNLAQYALPQTVDVILFNFGWLPGAAHSVFSQESSSIPALNTALELLKKGGILSAILYSGTGIGHAEKDAVLSWMQQLPVSEYIVLVCQFANWADTAPLPCFVLKK